MKSSALLGTLLACALPLAANDNGDDQAKVLAKKGSAAPSIESGKVLGNVFEKIPYNEKEFGKRKWVDEKQLLLVQIALLPGQLVPKHNANSNVVLLVVEGEVVVWLDGKEVTIKKGDLLPIAYKTPMSVRNDSKEKASFMPIKAPNPTEMEKKSDMN